MSSELKVDTISEKTSANGVVIDGVTVKDGGIASSFITGGIGKVLQVVTGTTNTDTGSITSESYVDTGLTASITPSATSSKIMIMISQTLNAERDGNAEVYGYLSVVRASTKIWEGFFTGGNGMTPIGQTAVMYVDSPSSTSSLAYKTQFKVYPNANGGKVRAQQDSQLSSRMSSIHLLEIAG